MKISIITLFAEVFTPILDSSILGRAQKKGLVEFELINLRDFGEGKHKSVDDKPYGGGTGMLLRADVLAKAVKKSKQFHSGGESQKAKVILTSASGKTFNQAKARNLSKLDHLILVCGHYEGVDQRFIDKYVDEEISIGDYVLTGGEIAAMAIIDVTIRLIKGVLDKESAIKFESFENNLLEYPQYTRPGEFEGLKVPKILLSGDHQKIDQFRFKQAALKTRKIRPDLLKKAG